MNQTLRTAATIDAYYDRRIYTLKSPDPRISGFVNPRSRLECTKTCREIALRTPLVLP